MSFHKSIIASGATSTPAAFVAFNLKREDECGSRPQQTLPQPPSSPTPISTDGNHGVTGLFQVAPLGSRAWGL